MSKVFLKAPLFGLKTSSPHVYYYIALCVVLLCLVSSYRIIHSRIGRAWISIREDELAAKSLGVQSKFYKAINFMFGAFWAGVGGALMCPLLPVYQFRYVYD